MSAVAGTSSMQLPSKILSSENLLHKGSLMFGHQPNLSFQRQSLSLGLNTAGI